jgi:hypothetical protein
MKPSVWWLVGGGAALAFALMSRSDTGTTGWSSADLDALARMLIVEHFGGSDEERAQIIWVALNRARKLGVPIPTVVEPGTRKGVSGVTGATWNGSDKYRAAYERAASDPRFGAAKAFVRRVLAGEFSNQGFKAFIHPNGMSSPPCSVDRVAVSTFTGTRCIPKWAVNPTRVGAAYFYA